MSDSIFTTERTEIAEKATEDLNTLSGRIIDCALQVHKKLGPGLLESAYCHGLTYVFSRQEILFEKEKIISIHIDNCQIDAGYRADFIIDDKILLEVKSVEKLLPIHEAQLLTYMKLGNYELGFLLNFNHKLMKDGIKRMRL
ncbi:MAG TPA: GxxExxY protein [Micavibrio sp.]|jgi:GxxExxY protein